VLVITLVMTAFQSSLQHEALHGHPTRSTIINEAFAFPAVGIWFPYRRYRTLHLKHHIDPHLTDPLEDPESWYRLSADWSELPPWQKTLLRINATLAGRLIVGPALSWCGLWRSDLKAILEGDTVILREWGLHALGLLPVIAILQLTTLPIWLYVVLVAYPATSIILVRSFIEHRAARQWPCRTAVVNAGKCMSLLYLNNNLHAVHHREPACAWYRLPQRWREQRTAILRENDGYFIAGGYREVFRTWFMQQREPVVHPLPDSLRPASPNR